MRRFSILIFTITILFLNRTQAQDTLSIQKTLTDWNRAVMTKDLTMANAIFDTNAKVILIGSEEEEIHQGNLDIRNFIKDFFTKPITLSWNYGPMMIDQNNKTAWVFVNGTSTEKQENGSMRSSPYRITTVSYTHLTLPTIYSV